MVHVRAVSFKPLILDAMRGRADLALRLQRYALCFQAPMVDARINVEFDQPLVGKLSPAFAPTLNRPGVVPVPHPFSAA